MVDNGHNLKERMEQLKKELHASEARFRNIVTISSDGIVIVDESGIICFANPAVENLFDRKKEELLGEQFGIPVVAGNTTELEIVTRGERHSIVEMRVVATEWEGNAACLATLHDVTERRLAEIALRESEALFRVVFDQSYQLMGLLNPDGTVIKINRTAVDFIAAWDAEIIGKPFWEAPGWDHSPEQQERLQEAIKTAAGGEFVRYEAIHQKPGGELVYVDFSLKPVTAEDGNIIYLVPEARDITAYKHASEQIEILNTDLAARAVELETANRELEAFNYTVSHDLRQPLNVINGYCQAVDTLCGDQLQEDCRSYLQEIYSGTVRMDLIIEALLKFSRMSHVELSREMVDLSSLASEVTLSLKMTEPGRQVDFQIADGIVANADADLLWIVLENLLGNAWKYTGMQEKAIIAVGVTHSDRIPVYFIRDNGAGFDKADVDKLFVPFQRLPGAEKFKGSGIGLATVERIIRSHGGKIWAEGEPGKGATFYFTLPVVQVPEDTA
jgi:PAS domain S-box-containing protein